MLPRIKQICPGYVNAHNQNGSAVPEIATFHSHTFFCVGAVQRRIDTLLNLLCDLYAVHGIRRLAYGECHIR